MTSRLPPLVVVFSVVSIISLLALSATGQPIKTTLASYTTAQAQAGEETYQDVCASCHKADLGGASDTPQLAGTTFLGMWGGRPATELFAYVNAAMPPAGRKPDADTLVNVVAYILKKNGMPSGRAAFDATAAGVIAPAVGTR
jgi:mono/diheme cytochrome c family protein